MSWWPLVSAATVRRCWGDPGPPALPWLWGSSTTSMCQTMELNHARKGHSPLGTNTRQDQGSAPARTQQPRTRWSSRRSRPGCAGRASGSAVGRDAAPGRDSFVLDLGCCSRAGNPALRPPQSNAMTLSFTWTPQRRRTGLGHFPATASPRAGPWPQLQPRAGRAEAARWGALTCLAAPGRVGGKSHSTSRELRQPARPPNPQLEASGRERGKKERKSPWDIPAAGL